MPFPSAFGQGMGTRNRRPFGSVGPIACFMRPSSSIGSNLIWDGSQCLALVGQDPRWDCALQDIYFWAQALDVVVRQTALFGAEARGVVECAVCVREGLWTPAQALPAGRHPNGETQAANCEGRPLTTGSEAVALPKCHPSDECGSEKLEQVKHHAPPVASAEIARRGSRAASRGQAQCGAYPTAGKEQA